MHFPKFAIWSSKLFDLNWSLIEIFFCMIADNKFRLQRSRSWRKRFWRPSVVSLLYHARYEIPLANPCMSFRIILITFKIAFCVGKRAIPKAKRSPRAEFTLSLSLYSFILLYPQIRYTNDLSSRIAPLSERNIKYKFRYSSHYMLANNIMNM